MAHMEKRIKGERLPTVTLIAMATIIGTACSTNPRIPSGGSIQDFAKALSGAQFTFDLSGKILVPSMSGALMTAQRIPEGMLTALAPARQHCARDGGELSFTRLQDTGRANLPNRMECRVNTASLWAVDLAYQQVRTVPGEDAMGRMTLSYLKFTVQSEYVTNQELVVRSQAERQRADARARADAARSEQLARETAIKATEAERRATEWPARVEAFRANLRSGDRCEWKPSAPVAAGPLVGVVVRIEGAMAYVQFENLVVSGQTARYVPKIELVPYDSKPPAFRFEIK